MMIDKKKRDEIVHAGIITGKSRALTEWLVSDEYKKCVGDIYVDYGNIQINKLHSSGKNRAERRKEKFGKGKKK